MSTATEHSVARGNPPQSSSRQREGGGTESRGIWIARRRPDPQGLGCAWGDRVPIAPRQTVRLLAAQTHRSWHTGAERGALLTGSAPLSDLAQRPGGAGTPLVLQRHLVGGRLGVGLVERCPDARPEAVLPPAPVAAVDAAPRAEPAGQRPPRAAGPLHPEHRRHHAAMIAIWPSPWWPLRWPQRQQASPLLLGQSRAAACRLRGRRLPRRGERHRTSRPARDMPALGCCLMLPPPPTRPVQPELEALVRLSQRQQQPAHLGRRQRDQLTCRSEAPLFPPPCSGTAVACARVTSR